MGEEFSGTAPIYYQIVQKICSQIVRGELLPGDKLPSVRDLAIQLGVNPNTVQRVYMELEQLALAESRRGQGTYVTEDLSRLKQLREQLSHDKIETFVKDMKEIGFTADETAKGLMEYLNGHKEEGGKRK